LPVGEAVDAAEDDVRSLEDFLCQVQRAFDIHGFGFTTHEDIQLRIAACRSPYALDELGKPRRLSANVLRKGYPAEPDFTGPLKNLIDRGLAVCLHRMNLKVDIQVRRSKIAVAHETWRCAHQTVRS